MAPFILYIRTI